MTGRSHPSLTGLVTLCPFQMIVKEWSIQHHMEGAAYQAGGIDRTLSHS